MSSLIADNRVLEMASYGSGDSGGIGYTVGNLSVGVGGGGGEGSCVVAFWVVFFDE